MTIKYKAIIRRYQDGNTPEVIWHSDFDLLRNQAISKINERVRQILIHKVGIESYEQSLGSVMVYTSNQGVLSNRF